MDILWNRRSIRKFTDQELDDSLINKVISAGMYAPSAANQRPWEFLVIKDAAVKEKISKVSPYAKPALRAPVVLILLGNMDNLTFPQYWEQDMSACTQNILLECTDLGLGAVWLGVAPEKDRMDYIKDLFSLPVNVRPFSIIPIGYPETDSENSPVDRDEPEKIHRETY